MARKRNVDAYGKSWSPVDIPNLEKAVELYLQAAEQNVESAYNKLGDCYTYGYGVEQNYEKAIEWYTKAAEKGNAWAQDNLGSFYEYGKGVEKDINKAIEWYTKAASKGNKHANTRLSRLK